MNENTRMFLALFLGLRCTLGFALGIFYGLAYLGNKAGGAIGAFLAVIVPIWACIAYVAVKVLTHE